MFSDEDIQEIPESSYTRPGDEIISIRTTEEDGNIAALVSEPGFGTTGQTTFGKQIDAALTSEMKMDGNVHHPPHPGVVPGMPPGVPMPVHGGGPDGEHPGPQGPLRPYNNQERLPLDEAAKRIFQEMEALPIKSPVSVLRELLARRGTVPKYELVQVEGMFYERTFRYQVTVADLIAMGTGRSKPEAKLSAAKAFLDKLTGAVPADRNTNGSVPKTGTPVVSSFEDELMDNPVGWLQELCVSRFWPLPFYHAENKDNMNRRTCLGLRQYTVVCTLLKRREVGTGESEKFAKRQAAYKMWQSLQDNPPEAFQPDAPETEVCKMTFNRVSTQISHRKTHSDEKPYLPCAEKKCIMEEELSMLKKSLISLVVSSPTTMTVGRLLKDYRSMVGGVLPLAKYGYREPLPFLKERCTDIFVIEGPSWDPILTPKVTKNLAHIDQMVQKQRVRSTANYKGKRRSILPPNTRDISPNRYDSPKRFFPQTINMINRYLQSNGYKKTNKNEYNSDMDFPSHLEQTSKRSAESGGQSYMSSGSKQALLEQLKKELVALIHNSPGGVWCSNLIQLYKETYGRELKFNIFGHTCLNSFIYSMEDLFVVARSMRDSDWLLQNRNSVDAGVKARVGSEAGEESTSRRVIRHVTTRVTTNDNTDSLPGVDFDTDVFPPDSLHYLDSVPGSTLDDVAPGSTLEVLLGEVYSPSHFWMLRVGEQYHQAMELIMDHMNEYYNGEGKTRVLARGALRVGQYCAVLYHGDWHRALIVCIVDNDTVKVRHADYGTVDSVSASTLKPLLRKWGVLPAQAIRGRLAAVRPAGAGWRWPLAACAAFLHSVRERRLYAHIVKIDPVDDIVETFLIDTSGKRDICLTKELIRVEHADARHDSALQSDDCYLYPRFEALESGATPNYADIRRMLADGIRLEYVDTYRRHVPGPWARPPAPAPIELPPSLDLLRLEDTSPSPPPPPPQSSPPSQHSHPPLLSHPSQLSQRPLLVKIAAAVCQPQHSQLQQHSQLAQFCHPRAITKRGHARVVCGQLAGMTSWTAGACVSEADGSLKVRLSALEWAVLSRLRGADPAAAHW